MRETRRILLAPVSKQARELAGEAAETCDELAKQAFVEFAVAARSRDPDYYSLVRMDLQMPVLHGY